jgi:tRNA(fMet)-specific endonuclease VapC
MRYLLDTNVVILLLARKSAIIEKRIFECRAGEIGLPSIVAHELFFGAYRSQKISHNLETLRLLFRDFAVTDFTQDDAQVSGEIRGSLAASGTPIGPYDVLIAGQAKARGLILITNNTREFQRVAGLRIEDWTQ